MLATRKSFVRVVFLFEIVKQDDKWIHWTQQKEKKEKCRVENNDVERVQKLRGPIVSLPETEIMLLFYCTSAFSVF